MTTTLSVVPRAGISLRNFENVELILSSDLEAMKAKALKGADAIGTVLSAPSEQMAVDAQAEINIAIGAMKRAEEAAKDPLNAMRTKILDFSRAYQKELIERKETLKKKLGDFAFLKEQERQEEERLRQIELKKLADEQRKLDEEANRRAAAQAKAEQDAREAQERADNAKTAKAREAANKAASEARAKAEAEALKLAESCQKVEEKREAIIASVPVVAPKAEGSATKFVLKYAVVNIEALYAAEPGLVELTDKKREINIRMSAMEMVNPKELPKIAGLRIWREADVSARRAR